MVRYFHGVGTVPKQRPSLPLRPLPKKKKISSQTPQYKQREAQRAKPQLSFGWFYFFFPYDDVVADL